MATNYKEGLSRIQPHTWKIAFIFAFLALLVDGADLMLLSYSLNSIKADFGLSSVQAGMLGSFTLAGMAVGGIFGGWACDKFGRVRIVVISILTFSLLTCGLGFTQSFLQFGILRFLHHWVWVHFILPVIPSWPNMSQPVIAPQYLEPYKLAGPSAILLRPCLQVGLFLIMAGACCFMLRLFLLLLLFSCMCLYPNQKHGKSLDYNNLLLLRMLKNLGI